MATYKPQKAAEFSVYKPLIILSRRPSFIPSCIHTLLLSTSTTIINKHPHLTPIFNLSSSPPKQLTKPLSQEAYTTSYSQYITKLRYHPKRPSLQQNTRLPNPSLFYHEYMRLALVALDINGNIWLLLRPLLSSNANTNFCNLEALSTCAALALLGLAMIKTHTLEKKTDKKITMHNLHLRMQV